MMSEQPTSEQTSFLDYWYGKLLASIILLGFAYYLNTVFEELETGQLETVLINTMIALMYETIGRYPTIGIFGLLGVGFLAFGLRQFFTEN
ncbi:MAG: hypothetical protein MUF87_17095 [Anaerolineae bacterium]|nr:hypothetical protein [Anaerolineae bacterium]